MVYNNIFKILQRELQTKFEISSTISHKGEKGRKREAGLSGFLKEYLPDAYGVGTGEVFSIKKGKISPQCDIIIFDKLRTPIIGKNDIVQQIPIEGVYAVIEVKSVIDSKALKDALQKYRKIYELYDLASQESNKSARLEFFLFGYTLKVSDSLLDDFIDNLPVNMTLVSLDTGCSISIGSEDNLRNVFIITTNYEENLYSTLTFFYVSVLAACDANIGGVNYKDLLSEV